MTGKFRPTGDIRELGLDIPLNWNDMQSMFGYMLLCKIINIE